MPTDTRPTPAALVSIIGTCPGLAIGDDGLVWTDSRGVAHQLAKAVRLTIGDVAIRLNRSTDTVFRRISTGEIYPIIRHSARDIEIYEVAVTDYLTRATMRTGKESVRG